MLNLDTATLLIVLSVLVFLTNAIVESLKMAFGFTGEKLLNKLALGVAIVLTLISYLAYTAIIGTSIVWYYIFGSILVGFIIGLISMTSWDKVISMYKNSQYR